MSSLNLESSDYIAIVMRQTLYSHDEAKVALEENDNNYIKVIKDALGIKKKESNKDSELNTSINQDIYKNIRNFMDTASPTIPKPVHNQKNNLDKINEEEN